jgi:saccharopine dehydrogenase (NAD+, L-lysine forming)
VKIGLSRERKNPPDNRVALSPIQCVALQQRYPQIKVSVESSPTRCFSDEAYREVGVDVVDSLERCDVIFNIKEVPSEALIAGKTYFFFSHTIKKQPYNRGMLQTVLKKHITLIDYEVLALRNRRPGAWVLVGTRAWWAHTTAYLCTAKSTVCIR